MNPTPPSRRPLILMALGVILILGSIVFVAVYSPGAAPLPTPTQEAGVPYPDIKRVSLGDAKAAYDLKEAVFVDARDAQSYAQEHIPGALSIPEGQESSHFQELNPQNWIITYCT